MPEVNFCGIDEIHVKDYKSITDETIELCPITILAGANSSGKSSMMQPLLLLKQTLEVKNSSIPLWLFGENVYLTQYEQIRPKFEPGKNEFEIGVKNNVLRAISTFRHNEKAKRIEIAKTAFDYSPLALKNRETSSYNDLKKIAFDLHVGMPASKIKETINLCQIFRGIDLKARYELKEDSCFLAVKKETPPQDDVDLPGSSDDVFRFAGEFDNDLQGIIHLPELRSDPSERVVPRFPIMLFPSHDTPSYFFKGKFPRYTGSMIEAWEQEDNEHLAKLTEHVNHLSLTTRVATRIVDDSFMEIVVGWHPTKKPSDKKDMVNIADVGCGVSQVLPILVALIAAKKSQIVYIEQPAIHLHPKVLSRLADVIAEAAERGVKVVVETHSAFLVLALQTIIAKRTKESKLTPEKVALYWFEKQSDGKTKISKGTMNDCGDYDNWPEDFVETNMKTRQNFLNAYFTRRDGVNPAELEIQMEFSRTEKVQ